MRVMLLIIACTGILSGCVSTAYIHTPNDVNKMKSIVYMADGTVKKGVLTVNFESYSSRVDIPQKNEISFVAEGDTTIQQLSITSIKSYLVDGKIYEPKIIDLYFTGQGHYLFVRRMTEEKAKMQLYELYQSYKSNDTGEETSYYFISFPSFSSYEVAQISSNKLVPGFEYKMSAYVADCPELSKKIQSKEKAYYYSFTSLRYKQIEVIQRIVKEYNDCR